MAESKRVIVKADPDAEDCFATAVNDYRQRNPQCIGWDLAPEWVDEDNREEIALTVPVL
jgi:hypothetical protein